MSKDTISDIAAQLNCVTVGLVIPDTSESHREQWLINSNRTDTKDLITRDTGRRISNCFQLTTNR